MKKMRLILVVVFVITAILSFSGCKPVEYLTSQDGSFLYELYTAKADSGEYQAVRIIQYIGEDEDVIIPELLDGYPVMELADGLFVRTVTKQEDRRREGVYTSNTLVKTVTILADIKAIPDRAFYYCTELTDVVIPEGVEKIGAFSFFGCAKLQEITMPSTITEISGYAFRECSALEKVIIMSTERPIIGEKVFYMLDSTRSGNSQYSIIEGLSIEVADISLFSQTDIEQEYKTKKTKEYLYWLEYIEAGMLLPLEQN